MIVRATEHVVALEHAVLARFSDRAPCRSKQRRPPSVAARTVADRIRGAGAGERAGERVGERVVVDLAAYAAAAQPRSLGSTTEEANQ